MKDINNILEIIKRNFSQGDISYSINDYLSNTKSVHLKVGKLEADIMYGKQLKYPSDEWKDDIAISWNDKRNGYTGGMYGVPLEDKSEEEIVIEMIQRVFHIEPQKGALQLSIFDFGL